MSSQPFDPYHLWLGIPPKDQPPDAYRLLGIGRFESDPAVIENAVELRNRHLSTKREGAQGDLANELIRHVQQAGSLLLDTSQKAQYDAQLKQLLQDQLAPAVAAHAVNAAPAPVSPRISAAPLAASAAPLAASAAPLAASAAPLAASAAPLAASAAPLAASAAPLAASAAPLAASAAPLAASAASTVETGPVSRRRRRGSRSRLPLLAYCGAGALAFGILFAAAAASMLGWWSGEEPPKVAASHGRAARSNQGVAGRAPRPVTKPAGNDPDDNAEVATSTVDLETAAADGVAASVSPAVAAKATAGPASNNRPGNNKPVYNEPTPGKMDTETPSPARPKAAADDTETPAGATGGPASTASPPPTASPAAAPSSGSPFANSPNAVELPSPLIKQPRALMPLPSGLPLEMELRGEHAKTDRGKTIVSKLVEGETNRWRVWLVDDSKTGGESAGGMELAQFAYRDGELQFVWTSGAPVEQIVQAKNCVLRLAAGEYYHELALRKPLEQDSLTISLAKKIDVRVLELSHIPNTDNVQLEVEPLSNFPVAAKWKDDRLKAKKGDYLAIELIDYQGAEIRFKVDRKGRDEMAIYVSPIYKPNAKVEFDLSIDRLEALEQGTQKALIGARRDLVRASGKMNALKARQRSVNSQPSSTFSQKQAKATAQFEVNREIASTNRKILSAKAKIPEMEARLKGLPVAKSVVSKIHDHAKVNLRVRCEGEDVILPLYGAGVPARSPKP